MISSEKLHRPDNHRPDNIGGILDSAQTVYYFVWELLCTLLPFFWRLFFQSQLRMISRNYFKSKNISDLSLKLRFEKEYLIAPSVITGGP